jgi:hypothetical protein
LQEISSIFRDFFSRRYKNCNAPHRPDRRLAGRKPLKPVESRTTGEVPAPKTAQTGSERAEMAVDN